LEWFLLIQIPDMARYIFGPLPSKFCLVQLILRNAIFSQILLFLDGIIICRYIFIFWLKNPTVFQDDFWSLFINIWILGFVNASQISFAQIPGRKTLYYYICSGENPLSDQKIPTKIEYITLSLIVFTILTHIFICIKLHFFRREMKANEFPVSAKTLSLSKKINDLIHIESELMTDLTTSICSVSVLSTAILIFWPANKFQIQDYNCFPNYLYEYFFRMVWPNLLASTFIILHYCRNPGVKLTLKNQIFNYMYNLKVGFN
jgi:hypothetical protein